MSSCTDSKMSVGYEQEQNTAKLVMNTFYKLAGKNGVTAIEIARFLQNRYGDVWRINTLVGKAEETLKHSTALGFLDKRGGRYVTNLAREMRCRRRRKRCRRRRRRRSCRRRRRRRSCCCS